VQVPVPAHLWAGATAGADILGGVLSGLVIVDKPQGWTSHDVVGRMRRIAGTRKVGHAGTLDPMATGVLVVGINKATRLLTYIVGTSKTYTATIRLGQSTITDDAEGEVVATTSAAAVTDAAIHDGVAALTGLIQQVPSSVSAIKVNGERAYARVRSGEEVKLAARPVTIHRFEVHGINRTPGTGPGASAVGDPAAGDSAAGDLAGDAVVDIDVTVECSSGTYIRALARDLGNALGVGGHLTALRRTHVGPYSLEQARTLEQLAEDLQVLEMSQAARALMPNRELTAEETTEISFGRRIAAGAGAGTPAAATADHPAAGFAPDGSLVALLADSGNFAKPVLVFAPGNGARES
jgi:tRNA pseudouridine55 synthase